MAIGTFSGAGVIETGIFPAIHRVAGGTFAAVVVGWNVAAVAA